MTIQQQFKNLNGSEVTRKQLERIIANAKRANETEIVYRLSKILLDNKGVDAFDISLRNYPTALAGSRHKGAYKEALTECGRLRKGWKFSKGGVFKVATLDKKTKQFSMGLNGKKPCGCGGTKTTCGCKKKNLNSNDLSFDELEGLGLPFIPNPESVEEPAGLGKFTNDDIYQMITDKMIDLVSKSTGTGYKRKWGKKEFYEKDGFLIPINFVSKNAYRGVNPWMLKDDFLAVMDNPYFMTFKQIKEKKGKLKKGSKGTPIVYFTLLYKFENPKTKKDFGTYDKDRMINYIKKFGYTKADFDDEVNSIPILKYYNVFNGLDIEDIDFKLDELQLGRVVKSDESLANERNEAAELIVANYPKIAPTIKHGGDEAYYNSATDGVQMPRFQSFETPNDYYRTLLHELIHSTGNQKRLARTFGKKFGSKDYAYEELVAEFGSVFLSAQAGIIWHTNKNHEEYLTNWNNSLKIAKEDNRFLMRAASAAQKASDFALNLDANNVPAFHKYLGKIVSTKKSVKKTATKKTASIPDSSAYPVAVTETPKTIKVNPPFDSCGRLRKGWYYKNSKLTQVASKVKATKKAEIKKIVKAVVKKINKPTVKAVKRLKYSELIKKAKFKVGDKVYYLNNANQKQFRTIKYISRYDTVNKQAVHYGFTGVDTKTRDGFPEAKLFKKKADAVVKSTKKEDVTKYAYQKITTKEIANLSDEKLYLLYRAIAKQQNEKGIDGDLIRYNRSLIIKALKYPLKHYLYLDKTYNFILDELIDEKILFDYVILVHEANMYPDEVIAKGYAYNKLAWFIYYHRKSFPFYQRTELIEQVAKPELGKLFEKEIKKRKLTVNVDINIPLNNPPKKTTDAVVKPAVKKGGKEINITVTTKIGTNTATFKTDKEVNDFLEKLNKDKLQTLFNLQGGVGKFTPSKYLTNHTSNYTTWQANFGRNNEVRKKPLYDKMARLSEDSKITVSIKTNETEKLGNPIVKSGSSLASKLANRQNKVAEFYKIQDENISEFLGKIEVKEKESVVITLTGGQGSMKTRCAFRFINAFAQNYKVGHASIEEHPESTLYWNKVHEYISDKAMANISNPEIKSISDLDKLIQANDVIVIDSFAKLQEIERGFEVDKDLRKKYDGKIFIVIFQQTTDGKMRGGSKSQFDGDVILFTQKFDDYQENYIYADKNRYQNKNLSDLKYNIFEGILTVTE
ncbi:ArdC family protein [Tenacibaculum piscium]|uniref:ArdC family protein n=1 Tax=Tenacibaculum piscium TaxID=1458515 RepID=UPI001EECA727|nr:zincin-like metallopeptidase domain-containing protein [Tenacibaculum piscium]